MQSFKFNTLFGVVKLKDIELIACQIWHTWHTREQSLVDETKSHFPPTWRKNAALKYRKCNRFFSHVTTMHGKLSKVRCYTVVPSNSNITSFIVSQLLGDLKPYIVIVLDLVVDVLVVFVTQYWMFWDQIDKVFSHFDLDIRGQT